MQPLVSVIVPLYNTEKYIERCLNSLCEQTYTELEILVVDDGSTDGSAKIVKEIISSNTNIIYIYQENSGPGAARNNAIEQATGEYLLFIDADDYVSKDYVAQLVECAQRNQAELTITGYSLVYDDSKKKVEVIPARYRQEEAEEWAYRISSCCSRLYSRKFWLNNNIQFHQEEGARAEDVPIVLFSNVMARNIAIVKKAGYYYYQHSGSAMNNKDKKVIFYFPYNAFAMMYKRVMESSPTNSMDFFFLGVLKFLAQFDLVIYRKADKKERQRFYNYLNQLIEKDFDEMKLSWRRLRKKIDLPMMHKIAIEVFIQKYGFKNR